MDQQIIDRIATHLANSATESGREVVDNPERYNVWVVGTHIAGDLVAFGHYYSDDPIGCGEMTGHCIVDRYNAGGHRDYLRLHSQCDGKGLKYSGLPEVEADRYMYLLIVRVS